MEMCAIPSSSSIHCVARIHSVFVNLYIRRFSGCSVNKSLLQYNIKYCVERLCCVLYDEHQTRTHNKTALTPFNSFFMMRFTSTAPTMASHFWSEWFPANDKKSRHRDFTAHHQKPHSRKNGNININKNKRTDKQTKAAAAFCQNQM